VLYQEIVANRTAALVGCALVLLAVGCGGTPVVYVGGTVLTMDADNRVADALVADGERIAAVGSAAELRSWGGGRARVVDLAGKTVLPGFVDAHGHFPGVGIYAVHADLNSPPIGSVRGIDDIVERLRAKAAATASGKWIGGFGYDDTLLAEKRHPTRADLDRVSTEHPIAILHISGHLAAVNSRALSALGFTAGTRDPPGGRIRRDPRTGEPDGVLEEEASDRARAPLLDLGIVDALRVVRSASSAYARAGVTTAQNGLAAKDQIERLALASRIGFVSSRLIFWPAAEVEEELLSGTFRFTAYDDAWVRLGAVKLVADGSIQGYTAYLSQPYHVPPGVDPSYRGYPRMSREELRERVARYHAAGLQIAVHGNGDAAIDDILDAFEAAERAHPRADARHVIVHAQMARADQLDRMKRLGVIPSFFVLHTYYWGDRHRDVFLGPERAARISPTRSALALGLRFTLHTDAPVVPMEPLRLVWSAVNRRSAGGAIIGADERIDARSALRAVTIDAAFQSFQDKEKGSIEVGKLADLVILDRNPLDDPEGIDRIRVLETIVGGRTVFP